MEIDTESEEIEAVTFKDPEVNDGDIVVPIEVGDRYYGTTLYLPYSKLLTMEEKCEESRGEIEDLLDDLASVGGE